jgi:hypothetical protein
LFTSQVHTGTYAPKMKVGNMDSRIFIKQAGVLMEDIKTFQAAFLSHEDEVVQGRSLQSRIDGTFSLLVNPTLPSAYKLRDVAQGAGFGVNPKVLHMIGQFDNMR